MSTAPKLTDRLTLRRHRKRASRQPVNFIHEEAALEIEERLSEVNKSFVRPVLVGNITKPLKSLFRSAPVIDDEPELDFPSHENDLIIHFLGLHWADDPVGQLVQCRLALNPDGLFLGAMFGGSTLQELRTSLAEAESAIYGGLSPRVAPMADMRDLGGLLSRAGLALPVADSRKLTVRYPNFRKLVSDLRGMGETNALFARQKKPASSALFDAAENVYRTNFSDNEGYLIATFEVVFLTGWAPSESQQKPLRPGSAQTRLSDALGVAERFTGDRAKPDPS